MRRSTLHALLAVSIIGGAFALAACDDSASELTGGHSSRVGTHQNGDDDDTTTTDGTNPSSQAAADAKSLFTALESKLTTNCGPCHTTGQGGAPAWMQGPDAHATIIAYKGIVTDDPKTSILLTKPQHTGPAMPASLVPEVTTWLQAEIAAKTAAPAATTTATTTAIAIPSGAGSIDLPAPGGQITFTASLANGILNLKSVALVAPASTGLHASGVHLVLVHKDNTTTTNDGLAGADTTVAAGATAPLGIGLVVIPEVAADDQLQVTIDALVASTGGGTTQTLGGCKDVQSFQTNAAPQLTNLCKSCHNTGGSGNGSLDLSALFAATPDFAKACGQAKAKIDTTTPANSDIIQAPTGKVNGHPFKTAPASYTTAMTIWINAEK
jgi:hypothetical protein